MSNTNNGITGTFAKLRHCKVGKSVCVEITTLESIKMNSST